MLDAPGERRERIGGEEREDREAEREAEREREKEI